MVALTIGTASTVRNRGTYSAAVTYYINDVVTYLGMTYVATAKTTGNTPPNASYWTSLTGTGTGLPMGGTAGQILAKNTGTDQDVGWAAPPVASGGGQWPFVIPPSSTARWYDNRFTCALNSTSVSVPNGNVYYMPIYTSRTYQITGIGFYSAGVNSGSVTTGLYTASAGRPAAPLNSVNFTMPASGFYYATFTAVTMPAGLSFIAALGIGSTQSVGAVAANQARQYESFTTASTTGGGVFASTSVGGLSSLPTSPTVTFQQLATPTVWFLAST